MFVRMTRMSGATDIDAGVGVMRNKVVPELESQKGFRGLTATGDRTAGTVGVLSLWDTREDLEASESAAGKVRQEAMKAAGGKIEEVLALEQVDGTVANPPPKVGDRVMITSATMDPAKVDANLEYFRSQVLPGIVSQAGFCGCRHMVDRATGRAWLGTIWADEASMKAAAAAAEQRSAGPRERGVEISEPEFRELLFSHLV